MRKHAKFRAEQSNRCRDIPVFSNFNMAAVRHLRFLKLRNFECIVTVQNIGDII